MKFPFPWLGKPRGRGALTFEKLEVAASILPELLAGQKPG